MGTLVPNCQESWQENNICISDEHVAIMLESVLGLETSDIAKVEHCSVEHVNLVMDECNNFLAKVLYTHNPVNQSSSSLEHIFEFFNDSAHVSCYATLKHDEIKERVLEYQDCNSTRQDDSKLDQASLKLECHAKDTQSRRTTFSRAFAYSQRSTSAMMHRLQDLKCRCRSKLEDTITKCDNYHHESKAGGAAFAARHYFNNCRSAIVKDRCSRLRLERPICAFNSNEDSLLYDSSSPIVVDLSHDSAAEQKYSQPAVSAITTVQKAIIPGAPVHELTDNAATTYTGIDQFTTNDIVSSGTSMQPVTAPKATTVEPSMQAVTAQYAATTLDIGMQAVTAPKATTAEACMPPVTAQYAATTAEASMQAVTAQYAATTSDTGMQAVTAQYAATTAKDLELNEASSQATVEAKAANNLAKRSICTKRKGNLKSELDESLYNTKPIKSLTELVCSKMSEAHLDVKRRFKSTSHLVRIAKSMQQESSDDHESKSPFQRIDNDTSYSKESKHNTKVPLNSVKTNNNGCFGTEKEDRTLCFDLETVGHSRKQLLALTKRNRKAAQSATELR